MLYMYMYMYVHTYERHFSPGWASRAYTHKIMRCTACVKTISPMAGCLVHANVHAATACMNAISPMDRRLIVTSLCVCRHMCTYTCLCKTCSACVSAITPTTGCLIVIAVCMCVSRHVCTFDTWRACCLRKPRLPARPVRVHGSLSPSCVCVSGLARSAVVSSSARLARYHPSARRPRPRPAIAVVVHTPAA